MRLNVFALVFCSALSLATSSFANTGTLDTANFGAPNGYILENFTQPAPTISAMALKDDGKIVVVGKQSSGGLPFPAFIAQFNADGSLDTSFNSSGMHLFQITQNWQGSHTNNEDTTAKAVALVSDGILVAGGYSNVSPAGAYLMKFNFDGSFASFGTDNCNGSTSPNCSKLVNDGSHSYAFVGLGVTSANNILVVGNNSTDTSFFVSQYDSSGNFNSSFGGSGFVVSPNSSTYTAYAAAMQTSDDKVLIGGSSTNSAMLARVGADGNFDSDFGISGIALYQVAADEDTARVESVAIGADGSIAAAGLANLNGGYYGGLLVMKLNSSGVFDPNFAGGFVFDDTDRGSVGRGVALQSDASVLVGGTWVDDGYNEYMALLRYLPNGSLDPNFGSNGIALPFMTYGAGTALLYHDGKVDLAGYGVPSSSFTDIIAQFLTAENQADLSIVKTAAASTASLGDAVGYTLTVSNAGPQEAFNIAVSDPLPDGLGLVAGSLQSSAATCALEGSTIVCSLFSLTNGDSFTVTYQASASSAGTLTNTATVSSSTDDPDPDNNSSSASITASGSSGGTPDLEVSIDCPSEASIGEEVTCETTVQNDGDGDSTDTTIAFTASDNWQFVSSSLMNSSLASGFLRGNASALSCSGDPESCSLGTLAAGSSVTLGVLMRVTGEGELTLSAVVSGNGGSASGSGSATIGSSSLSGTGCALNVANENPATAFWIYSLFMILLLAKLRLTVPGKPS